MEGPPTVARLRPHGLDPLAARETPSGQRRVSGRTPLSTPRHSRLVLPTPFHPQPPIFPLSLPSSLCLYRFLSLSLGGHLPPPSLVGTQGLYDGSGVPSLGLSTVGLGKGE